MDDCLRLSLDSVADSALSEDLAAAFELARAAAAASATGLILLGRAFGRHFVSVETLR
jgi:hypothetical protein